MLAAQGQRQRFGLAVFRDEADADVGANGVGRRGDDDGLAIDPEAPRGQVGHAETGQEKIELPHALKAGDAEDLAGPQAERGVAELAGSRNALRGKHLGSKARPVIRSRRECVGKRAPGDHPDDLVVEIERDRARCDMRPVAQHRHRVAKGSNLPQAMRYEHDRHAFSAQSLDDPAEPLDVASGKSGRRLVEQKDARLAEQSPGDLDLLLDGKIQFAGLVV